MESLIQPIIKALGWSLIHSLWQGALIYGLVIMVFLLVPKLSANAKHNISFAAICGMFGWFLITLMIKVDFSSTTMSPVFLENSIASLPFNAATINNFFSVAESWFPLVAGVYLAGIVIQLFIFWKGYSILQKLRKHQLQSVPIEWQQVFEQLVLKLKIHQKIDFQLSTLAKVPMVIGYIKPIVLFPVQLFNHLDALQTEAILIHELSHIKRNDFLLNLLQTFIETFLFFNPFVWLISRLIKRERENTCDDKVIHITGKRIDYAEALFQLELMKTSATPQLSMAATHKKQHLLERIKRITLLKPNSMNTKQFLVTLSVVIISIFSIAWLIPSEKNPAKTTNQTINKNLFFTKNNDKTISTVSAADTLPPSIKIKTGIKIMVTDSNGVTTTYPSFSEMNDSLVIITKDGLRKAFKALKGVGKVFLNLDSSFPGKDFTTFFKDSAWVNEWKEWGEKFNSPEFKKQQLEWTKDFDTLKVQHLLETFNSPKFKQKQQEIIEHFNSQEFKQQQKKLMEQFNSPEFKKNQQLVLEQLEKLHLNNFTIEADSVYFNNNRYKIFIEKSKKKQTEEQLKNSKEYKKLQEKFEKDVEKLKKKMEKQS